MTVRQNANNVNALFRQALGKSAIDIDPDIAAYIDDAIDTAIDTATDTITAAYTAAIAAALTAVNVSIVTPETTTVTLQPCPVTYDFGTAAELTLTVTDTTHYHFTFTCPSNAATVLTLTGITGEAGDYETLEAGATYEVDVWNGIAVYNKLEVEPIT